MKVSISSSLCLRKPESPAEPERRNLRNRKRNGKDALCEDEPVPKQVCIEVEPVLPYSYVEIEPIPLELLRRYGRSTSDFDLTKGDLVDEIEETLDNSTRSTRRQISHTTSRRTRSKRKTDTEETPDTPRHEEADPIPSPPAVTATDLPTHTPISPAPKPPLPSLLNSVLSVILSPSSTETTCPCPAIDLSKSPVTEQESKNDAIFLPKPTSLPYRVKNMTTFTSMLNAYSFLRSPRSQLGLQSFSFEEFHFALAVYPGSNCLINAIHIALIKKLASTSSKYASIYAPIELLDSLTWPELLRSMFQRMSRKKYLKVRHLAKEDYWTQPFELKLDLVNYLVRKVKKLVVSNDEETEEARDFAVEKQFLGLDRNNDEYWFIDGILIVEDPSTRTIKHYYTTRAQIRALIRYLHLTPSKDLLEKLSKHVNEMIACIDKSSVLAQEGEVTDDSLPSETEPDTSEIPPLFSSLEGPLPIKASALEVASKKSCTQQTKLPAFISYPCESFEWPEEDDPECPNCLKAFSKKEMDGNDKGRGCQAIRDFVYHISSCEVQKNTAKSYLAWQLAEYLLSLDERIPTRYRKPDWKDQQKDWKVSVASARTPEELRELLLTFVKNIEKTLFNIRWVRSLADKKFPKMCSTRDADPIGFWIRDQLEDESEKENEQTFLNENLPMLNIPDSDDGMSLRMSTTIDGDEDMLIKVPRSALSKKTTDHSANVTPNAVTPSHVPEAVEDLLGSETLETAVETKQKAKPNGITIGTQWKIKVGKVETFSGVAFYLRALSNFLRTEDLKELPNVRRCPRNEENLSDSNDSIVSQDSDESDRDSYEEDIITDTPSSPQELSSESDSGLSEGEYIVERILDKRTMRGKIQYKVKWKGYSEAECTWEIEANMNCPKLIKEFEDAKMGLPKKEEKEDYKPKLKTCLRRTISEEEPTGVNKISLIVPRISQFYHLIEDSASDSFYSETEESELASGSDDNSSGVPSRKQSRPTRKQARKTSNRRAALKSNGRINNVEEEKDDDDDDDDDDDEENEREDDDDSDSEEKEGVSLKEWIEKKNSTRPKRQRKDPHKKCDAEEEEEEEEGELEPKSDVFKRILKSRRFDDNNTLLQTAVSLIELERANKTLLGKRSQMSDMKARMMKCWHRIDDFSDSRYFRHLPMKKYAPDYNQIVSSPIDLAEIKTRINNVYSSVEEFAADLQLMINNARTYCQAHPENENHPQILEAANRTEMVIRVQLRECELVSEASSSSNNNNSNNKNNNSNSNNNSNNRVVSNNSRSVNQSNHNRRQSHNDQPSDKIKSRSTTNSDSRTYQSRRCTR